MNVCCTRSRIKVKFCVIDKDQSDDTKIFEKKTVPDTTGDKHFVQIKK